jgi:hypothetical protein
VKPPRLRGDRQRGNALVCHLERQAGGAGQAPRELIDVNRIGGLPCAMHLAEAHGDANTRRDSELR